MFYGTAVWDPALIIAQARLACQRGAAAGLRPEASKPTPTVSSGRLTRRERACAITDCSHSKLVLHQSWLSAHAVAGCVKHCAHADLTSGGCLSLPRRHVRHAGPIAPRLSLFYFFDYSSIRAHSLMGWCAACRTRHTRSCCELRAGPLRNRMVIAAHLVNAVLGCAPRSARCV